MEIAGVNRPQQLVVLKRSKNKQKAKALVDFIMSSKAQAMLNEMGYLSNAG